MTTPLEVVAERAADVAEAEVELRARRARLVRAMRQANDDGASTTQLVTATGKARSWVHTQLHYDRRQG